MDNKEIIVKANQYINQEEDSFFKQQVEELIKAENWEELNDRFYKELSFGTGGLRGVIGGGSNRMNPLIVKRATQGLANYIKKTIKNTEKSVVIAYDSRNYSDLFALEAARVLAGNGIKTYLFTALRPTPELSFAVRKLKAVSGIVITASHNPSAYNGYKVYWNDGAQIIPPHDKGIIGEARAVKEVLSISKETALEKSLLVYIDKEIDEPYLKMVESLVLRPELVRKQGADFKVVYTPLHGTGGFLVSEALKRIGVNITFVEEQKEPDGNFPTVKYPNPEEASAMKLALELGMKNSVSLVMGTDPDSDRLGIAVPDVDEFKLISGNQLGVLLADYIFSTNKELGTMPPKPAMVKTIVTTELQRLIAEDYNAICIDTLTGFKYIGQKIREFEEEKNGPHYLVGGEESYGYLIGTEVRDKDAISAAVITVEMTLYHKSMGKTLMQRLNEIYEKYGYFEEMLFSKYFEGEEGFEIMQSIMRKIEEEPPSLWANKNTVFLKNYNDGTTLNIKTGNKQKDIDLPSSNVLQFILEDDTIISVRPSGTEPKIKFYASCRSKPGIPLNTAKEEVGKMIAGIKEEISGIV